MNALTWSPVHRVIEDRIASGDDLVLVIVPFIKVDALKQLHWVRTKKLRLKVVCRWRLEDLLSGSSDVEVFTYLRAAGCELYLNPDIHMKLYVFESNIAFNTSANLTLRGLGYSERPNIEVGDMVALSPEDLARVYSVVTDSRQVDDDMYARFKNYVDQNRHPNPTKPFPDLVGKPKQYTIASLPATESPAKLIEFYFAHSRDQYAPEFVRRAVHDLVTFGIGPGISISDFDNLLAEAFCNTPFVIDFVQFLKQETSLRFGAVNSWIHDKCEDVPLPYRWEVKENTKIFYTWLSYYIPEITWDRPNYSQIIYWRKGEPSDLL